MAGRPIGRLGGAGVLIAVAVLLASCERIADRLVARYQARARTDVLSSPDLRVILCGTGSPLPDPHRASACTAVVAGGELMLVDVGPGAWEVVDLADLPTGALSAVLLTHFHSDHIGDLGEAVTQSWIAGRAQPLDVYGPPGTARVVEGFRQAYAADVDARVAHHGETYLPRTAAGAVAHEVPLPETPTGATVVFERNGLRVTMFPVEHRPAEPAVGYRFDYRGRSVVISGDTGRSAAVIANARGADVLVHEALERSLVDRAARVAGEQGRTRLAKLAGDIGSYHTSPAEAGEVAKAAGVRRLVLTHLVPGPGNVLTRRLFRTGAARAFDGEVTVGEDGLEIVLQPAS